MNDEHCISEYIKKERKLAGLTQEQFAIRSGLGLRFIRELEQKINPDGTRVASRNIFGTTQIPHIEINDNTLKTLAAESTVNGYKVPGVQKKLSLHLLMDGEVPRLTLVNFPTEYILKPQVGNLRRY